MIQRVQSALLAVAVLRMATSLTSVLRPGFGRWLVLQIRSRLGPRPPNSISVLSRIVCLTVGLLISVPLAGAAELQCSPEPTDMAISYGDFVTCQLEIVGDSDRFRFNAAAGEVVTIQATQQSGGQPCMELFDSQATFVAGGCTSGRVVREDVTLTQAGPYVIRVADWRDDQTLNYTLSVECFGTCPATQGPPPQSAPKLTVSPSGLFFTMLQGSSADVRILNVSNAGSDAIDYTASVTTTTGGSWLGVSPPSGNLNPSQRASLAVKASPSGLPPGTYAGRITVSSDATGESAVVVVTMSISGSAESIILSQTGLTFRSVFGGGTVPPQNFRVLNSGTQPLFWTAMTTTLSGGEGWLAIAPTSGFTDPADPRPAVEVRVTPGDLEPGEYYGRVEVSATGVDNSPQSLSVVLNILPAGSDPGPVVDPLGLIFVGEPGGENPPAQTVLVSNLTRDPLTFTATAVFGGASEWFSHQPAMATVLTGESVPVEIQPDLAGLGAGVFRARLELQFAESGRMREVELLLVISPGAGAEASATQPPLLGSPKQDLCIPSELLLAFTRLGTNFTVTAGWPTRIEVESVDECGSPMDKGAVQVSFSNGDVPLSLTSLRDGRWASTWVSRDTSLSEVTVTAQAVLLNPPIEGTAEITVGLQADATPPVIGAGAVVSAASFEPQVPLAPGSLISIFGERLSDATDASKALPLSTDLSGTSVTIAGRPMPLLFVSEGQINAMVPFTVPANTRHQVLVRRGSTVTVPEPITLADAHPGVFSEDQTGEGQGIIVTADGRLVEPGNPVKPGDAIVIFAAGLGEVDPPLQAGEATPLSPLSWTTNSVTVTVGGLEADVFFAGATPKFTGLYQVNAFIPEGVTPGSEVEVVVTVAGQSSRPVTIATE